MNRDDIIKLARKAGIAKHGLGWTCWEGQLERFAALVAAAEREACAKLWQKDAERYRFLRDRAWPFEFKGDDPKDADAAIDLARGKEADAKAEKEITRMVLHNEGAE